MYFHYYPKFTELKYIYNYAKEKIQNDNINLNFFFDFKNGLTIIENNIDNVNFKLHLSELLMTTFRVINFIQRYYFEKLELKNVKLKFIFFCETGKSLYHKRIDKMYKSNRIISDYLIRPNEQLSKEIILKAISLLYKTLNYSRDCYFYLGKFMEFDFIPYYFIKKFSDKENDLNIIMSTDKDHYQIHHLLKDYNILQLEKMSTKKVSWHPGRLFIDKTNYIQRLYRQVTLNNNEVEFIDKYYNLVRSFFGDSGDGINGIPGVQIKTFMKSIYPLISKYMKPMNEIYDMILKNEDSYFSRLDTINNESELPKDIFFLTNDFKIESRTYKKKKIKTFFCNQSRIVKNIKMMDYYLIEKSIDNNIYDIFNFVEKTNKDNDLSYIFESLVEKNIIDKEIKFIM